MLMCSRSSSIKSFVADFHLSRVFSFQATEFTSNFIFSMFVFIQKIRLIRCHHDRSQHKKQLCIQVLPWSYCIMSSIIHRLQAQILKDSAISKEMGNFSAICDICDIFFVGPLLESWVGSCPHLQLRKWATFRPFETFSRWDVRIFSFTGDSWRNLWIICTVMPTSTKFCTFRPYL
jgi:hypothetical protein